MLICGDAEGVIMEMFERTPWRVVDGDAALDAIQAAREEAITQLTGGKQSQRLALLADAEAACWERVFDRARTRAQWRAAIAAREWAQQLERTYRRRALENSSDAPPYQALARPFAPAVAR
jgi:hypothetical protein